MKKIPDTEMSIILTAMAFTSHTFWKEDESWHEINLAERSILDLRKFSNVNHTTNVESTL